MTRQITPTTRKPRVALDAAIARRRAELRKRSAIMAALTALAQQTDPMHEHGGLLSEVLEALQRGGLDVAGLLDCVLAEVAT